MKDQIVLVTGANGGLGTFVTRAFLAAGATVIGTSPKIQQSDFKEQGFTALPSQISSLESAKALVGFVAERFGRLDVLAHTVGGFAGGQPVAETDEEIFEQMLDLNLKATFYLLRAALPLMRKTGNARLIAIGSRSALEPGANVGAYSASKAAMVSLVKTVALENKDAGLTANVILPGTMNTPGNREAMPKADPSKWVQPATVASLMVWLASQAGEDMNGAEIPIYGAEA